MNFLISKSNDDHSCWAVCFWLWDLPWHGIPCPGVYVRHMRQVTRGLVRSCQGVTVTVNHTHQIPITWVLITATCHSSAWAPYQCTPPAYTPFPPAGTRCSCQFSVGSTGKPFKNRLLFNRLDSQYRARSYVTIRFMFWFTSATQQACLRCIGAMQTVNRSADNTLKHPESDPKA